MGRARRKADDGGKAKPLPWSMTVSRREREVAFGDRYQRADAPEGVCVYCGQAAKGLDHVPPLWRASLYRDGVFWLYPACGPCNSLLSVAKPLCVSERQGLLIAKLDDLARAAKPSRADRLGTFKTFPAKIGAIRERMAAGVARKVCRCVICRASARSIQRSKGE